MIFPLQVNLPVVLEVVSKNELLDYVKNLVYSPIVVPDFVNFRHHSLGCEQKSVQLLRIVENLGGGKASLRATFSVRNILTLA